MGEEEEVEVKKKYIYIYPRQCYYVHHNYRRSLALEGHCLGSRRRL